MAQPFHTTSSRASCNATRQPFRATKTHGSSSRRRAQCSALTADRELLMAGEQLPQPVAQLAAAYDTDVDISKLLEDAMKTKAAAKAVKSAAPPPAPATPSPSVAESVPALPPVTEPAVTATPPAPVAETISKITPAPVEPVVPVAPVTEAVTTPPAEVVAHIIEKVQPAAADAQLPDVSSGLDSAGSAVGAAASRVAEGAGKVQESLDGGLNTITSGVDAGVGQAVGAVTESAEKLQNALGSITGEANKTLGSITGEANKTLGAAASTVSEGAEKLGSAVTSQLTALQSGVDSVSAQLNNTYSATLEQIESAYRPVAQQVDSTVAIATRTINEEYIPTAAKLAGVAGVYAQQAAPYAAVGGALALALAYRSFQKRYSGFAGEISPEQVRELLLTDTALLVDIRSLEEREKDGLPQLKLAARFKAVVWEPIAFVPTIKANQLNNVDELVKDVNAAFIGGLTQVSTPLTKFIIMDSRGSDKAREVARALKRVGYALPFIMNGGFKNWQASELPTVEGTSYDATVVDLISDEIEVTYTRTVEALQPLANPWVGVPVAAGAVLGAFAIANYHKSLEYIGVLALLITIEKKLFSYNNPQELAKDVVGAAGTAVSFFGDKVSAVAAARAAPAPEFALSTEGAAVADVATSSAESASYEESRDAEPVASAAEAAPSPAEPVTESPPSPAEPVTEAVPAPTPVVSEVAEVSKEKAGEKVAAEIAAAAAAVAEAKASSVTESESPVEEKKPVGASTNGPKESSS